MGMAMAVRMAVAMGMIMGMAVNGAIGMNMIVLVNLAAAGSLCRRCCRNAPAFFTHSPIPFVFFSPPA
jgi:hypothetical protein